MALDKTRLKGSIKTKLEAIFGAQHEDATWFNGFCQSIADAVVDEIVTNAVVNGPVVVASVSGVTSGSGTSGPGAGTVVNASVS
jgi:hypothetical protein